MGRREGWEGGGWFQLVDPLMKHYLMISDHFIPVEALSYDIKLFLGDLR